MNVFLLVAIADCMLNFSFPTRVPADFVADTPSSHSFLATHPTLRNTGHDTSTVECMRSHSSFSDILRWVYRNLLHRHSQHVKESSPQGPIPHGGSQHCKRVSRSFTPHVVAEKD
ncbi:hypothetical protein K503DRAFT_266574 [Rhizopogon vinicolor AM-OR11-026]|uniref:Secreted protein n=1 Tax=Rhizopogon vinicolor AM-OR11-026 TaxID=1314800 RepID=A0A1B7MWH7_9AGAM|nr:hypothetical protein K503DRAFT_266574 [Rhizopogon vinicolor AM-OR11-026]